MAIVDRLTDDRDTVTQTGCAELCQHDLGVVLTHLNHRTKLLVEEHRCDICGTLQQAIEIQTQATVTGKRHFQHSGQQTTVGPVVVGQ